MKFPDRLRIGALRYRVVMCDRIYNSVAGHLMGEVDHSEGEIRIGAYLYADQRWETLIHEVLHAISGQLAEGQKLSEEHIQALSPYLLGFLIDNGLLAIHDLTPDEEINRAKAYASNDDFDRSNFIVNAPVKGGSSG